MCKRSVRPFGSFVLILVSALTSACAQRLGPDSSALSTDLTKPAAGAFTTLDVDGEEVRTFRDTFGVPHIFADSNRGLFVGYGYAVAQDRLWMLEMNRRSSQGRLAEVFGSGSLAADQNVRTLGYTGGELDAQFAQFSTDEQEIYAAFAAGINRYVTEVVAADPLQNLPFELHVLGIGVPAPWTVRDLVASGAFLARQFFERGGGERSNQTLLASLIARFGPTAGFAIFNDLRWINDSDAPVTIPAEGAFGKRQRAQPPTPPRAGATRRVLRNRSGGGGR